MLPAPQKEEKLHSFSQEFIETLLPKLHEDSSLKKTTGPVLQGWTLRASREVKYIRQRKTNPVRYHLHVESKKTRPIEKEIRCLWLLEAGGEGAGGLDEGGSKAANFQL